MRQVADTHKLCDKTLVYYFIKFFYDRQTKSILLKGILFKDSSTTIP